MNSRNENAWRDEAARRRADNPNSPAERPKEEQEDSAWRNEAARRRADNPN